MLYVQASMYYQVIILAYCIDVQIDAHTLPNSLLNISLSDQLTNNKYLLFIEIHYFQLTSQAIRHTA